MRHHGFEGAEFGVVRSLPHLCGGVQKTRRNAVAHVEVVQLILAGCLDVTLKHGSTFAKQCSELVCDILKVPISK